MSSACPVSAVFEEVISKDRVYGGLLREVKAAYDRFLRNRGAVSPPAALLSFPPASAWTKDPQGDETLEDMAELAVQAARRPWIAENSFIEENGPTPRQGQGGRQDLLQAVEALEQENAALKALVRRYRQELENPASWQQGSPKAAQPSDAPEDPPQSPSGSVWASLEPLSVAAWSKAPTQRPLGVPALDMKRLMEYLEEEEEEEEYADEEEEDYEDEGLDPYVDLEGLPPHVLQQLIQVRCQDLPVHQISMSDEGG